MANIKDKYIGKVLKLKNGILVVPFERIPKIVNGDWDLYGYMCVIISSNKLERLQQGDRQILLAENLNEVERII